ncbi:17333_t:CDS:1, partial [Racocetra persica]
TYTVYATATSSECDSALIGTSASLIIVSGVILPICIAFIFYYRRHGMATQSGQNTQQNVVDNRKSGATHDVREHGASE